MSQLERGIPRAAAKLLAFLERRGALTVGLFTEEWTETRCTSLIEACNQGSPVPRETNPHLVASALKRYMLSRPAPLLNMQQFDSIGSLAKDVKPREMEEGVKDVLKTIDADSFTLLSAVMSCLFRVSTFSNSNLMTTEKIATALMEALSHRGGTPQAVDGLALLIENTPIFFQANKLASSAVNKERRRTAYMAVCRLQEKIVSEAHEQLHWGFRQWINTSTKDKCSDLLAKTVREQTKGRAVLHKAVRHVRSTLLARGFQRWALLIDLKTQAFMNKCQSQIEVYAKWGKMKYDTVIGERRLWHDEYVKSNETVTRLEEQVSELQKRLQAMDKEKENLIKGNLVKIRKLAEIRQNPNAAHDDDDPALSVLQASVPDALANAQAPPVVTQKSDDSASAAALAEKQEELDAIRAKLVERTNTMTSEIEALKPDAERAPALAREVMDLELQLQQMLVSGAHAVQSLATKAIQGWIISFYRGECARLFLRWVHVVEDTRGTTLKELAIRADRRLIQLEDINGVLEASLRHMHRTRGRERGHHMMSRWWCTNAEWAFGRWQKAVCIRRLTVSLQSSITPVVARTILDSADLDKKSDELKKLTLVDSDFGEDALFKVRWGSQVVSDRTVFMNASETMLRHAFKLDAHGRSVEAAAIIACMERSLDQHQEPNTTHNAALEDGTPQEDQASAGDGSKLNMPDIGGIADMGSDMFGKGLDLVNSAADAAAAAVDSAAGGADGGASMSLIDLRAVLETNDLVRAIKERASAVRLISDELSKKATWAAVRSEDMLRSFVKEESSSTVSVKAEGLINSPLASLVVAALDPTRYQEWLPSILDASVCKETDVFRRDLRVHFVAPGPYANRWAQVTTSVVDTLDDDMVVVMAKTDPTTHDDKDATKVQADVLTFGFALTPITSEQTLVRILLFVDFKFPHDYCPPQVPLFIADTIAHGAFPALASAAARVQQQHGNRSCAGPLWGLHSHIDKRVASWQHRQSSRKTAHKSIEEVMHIPGPIEGFAQDLDDLATYLDQDLELMMSDFKLSGAASAILHDAKDSGTLVEDLGGLMSDEANADGEKPLVVDAPAPPIVDRAATSVADMRARHKTCLTTLSKARQRSKMLTVAASRKRTNRGGTGTVAHRTRDSVPVVEESALSSATEHLGDEFVGETNAQSHYLLFTSTYADGLEVRAKTDRILMILNARELQYDMVDLYVDPEIRQDMEELSGDRETLPQLFIDGDYLVDGLEELQYLHDNDLL